MIYTISIPHQRPASLSIFESVKGFIRAQNERSDDPIQTMEEAEDFARDDLNSMILLDTEAQGFLEDWRLEFNSCCSPQGELRHQGVKIQSLLLEALDHAAKSDVLNAGDTTAARSVLIACGRLEAEEIH